MRDPIQPADIQVGDRVERVIEARGVENTFRCVITRIEGGLIHAGWWAGLWAGPLVCWPGGGSRCTA